MQAYLTQLLQVLHLFLVVQRSHRPANLQTTPAEVRILHAAEWKTETPRTTPYVPSLVQQLLDDLSRHKAGCTCSSGCTLVFDHPKLLLVHMR